MKVTRIVFSPTGGTAKIAQALTSKQDVPVDEIDLTDAKEDFSAVAFARDDVAVIAVPSYGGRVPDLAAERIRRIHGSQAHCIIVCAYGNRAYEDTLLELNDVAERSGVRVIAAVGAVAWHSIMHQYAAALA